ncbi:heparinase II/III family protein [Halobacillus sp. MO56]
MLNKFRNYWLLMSRMNFTQIYYRFIKIIKFNLIYPKWGKKLFPFYDLERYYENQINHFYKWEDFNVIQNDTTYKKDRISEAEKICDLNFTFINTSHKFKGPIDWNIGTNKDKLWVFYLNYFEFLVVLIEAYQFTKNKKYIFFAMKLVDNWIDNTSPGQRNSWEPYTISLRLISWSYLWEILQKSNYELYTGFRGKFIGSIKQQADFLYSNLEKDLANNHYTANGKTLFWVGITFPFINNSRKYLNKGIEILLSQLLKEVREDGSQYENSTSYQVMTAKDYLEVLVYANKNNISLPKELSIYTEKMLDYIIALIKPDKSLPLLNDAVKDYPINANELLAVGAVFFNRKDFKFAAGEVTPYYLLKIFGNDGLDILRSMPESTPNYKSLLLEGSNYGVMRSGWENGSSYFLFDAGDIGPEHNAGHAHADSLSIFLHANNEDIFVDPGTYEYKAGQKRDYYRSTQSHNTIEIENEDQTTFWGAFRPGYIARSKLLSVDFNSNKESFSGLHDGYKRLKLDVTHRRDVSWDKGTKWYLKDSLTGEGIIKGKLYFQIGKTCKSVKISNEGCELIFNNSVVFLEFTSNNKIALEKEKAWISEEWKNEIKSEKIVVSFEAISPIVVETKIIVKNKT